jgi:hypothetical protein
MISLRWTSFCRLAVAAVGILAASLVPTRSMAGPVEDLPGYWTGTGAVTLASGNTEQLKCVVTYKIAGTSLKQNLRCANAAYTINGLADLVVRGDQVTGDWEEQTYAAKGSVTGKVVDGGFALSIQGANFTAAMKVSGTNCKQSVAITPTGLDVTKISLNLGKC